MLPLFGAEDFGLWSPAHGMTVGGPRNQGISTPLPSAISRFEWTCGSLPFAPAPDAVSRNPRPLHQGSPHHQYLRSLNDHQRYGTAWSRHYLIIADDICFRGSGSLFIDVGQDLVAHRRYLDPPESRLLPFYSQVCGLAFFTKTFG